MHVFFSRALGDGKNAVLIRGNWLPALPAGYRARVVGGGVGLAELYVTYRLNGTFIILTERLNHTSNRLLNVLDIPLNILNLPFNIELSHYTLNL